MNKIKVPKIKAISGRPGRRRGRPITAPDPLAPGRHTRARMPYAPTGEAAKADLRPARERRSSSSTAGARAQLAARSAGKPGPRLTALDHSQHRGLSDTGHAAPAKGNYPVPSGRRRKDTRQLTQDATGRVSPEGTRSQLAKRRAPMGQPTEADVRSARAGRYQAHPTKARGTAPAPARPLPGQGHPQRRAGQHPDPQHKRPVPEARRHPETSGRGFSDMGVAPGGGKFADRFFR